MPFWKVVILIRLSLPMAPLNMWGHSKFQYELVVNGFNYDVIIGVMLIYIDNRD
jgi:hypothetical protein